MNTMLSTIEPFLRRQYTLLRTNKDYRAMMMFILITLIFVSRVVVLLDASSKVSRVDILRQDDVVVTDKHADTSVALGDADTGTAVCGLGSVVCHGEKESPVARVSSGTPKPTATRTIQYSRPVKIGASADMQAVIDYAWAQYPSRDMILTFERESGFSNVVSARNNNGTRDHGECQLNSQYHSTFIHSKDFKQYKNRIDYCVRVYKDAERRGILSTTFYAYNVRHTVADRFMSNEVSKK